MREYVDNDYVIRLFLYPLIIAVIVFTAYSIFLMTNREINWGSVNKESGLYHELLKISNDLHLLFSSIRTTVLVSFTVTFIFLSILILIINLSKLDRIDTEKFLLIAGWFFIIIIISNILTIWPKSLYYVSLFGIFLAITINSIMFFEVFFLLVSFTHKIMIENRAKDQYRSFRRGIFYLSIIDVIAIYLLLGIYTLFSYISGGIDYSILQQNMTFVLFGTFNIILLIEIFRRYF